MEKKALIIGIVFIISGIVFVLSGLYFLSEKYLQLLEDSRSFTNEQKRKNSRALGKASGYFAFGFGSLTVIWGILIACFAPIKEALVIVYLGILLIVSIVLSIFVKTKK